MLHRLVYTPREKGREPGGRSREGAILDLLVIGGGIHGVAVARDAALRGLSVLLVERGDFADATSSRTSKLVHGGIRYLEHGHWRLVRESLRERAILLRLAPDLVRPATFLLPTYRRGARPRWMLRAGLALYALLAPGDPLAAHRSLGVEAALRIEPGLRAEGLTGALEFHDAQMDDALLCVATALAAERAGASLRTYVEAGALERAGRGWRVRLRDRDRDLEEAVEARWVVNAAGPWADVVRSRAGVPRSPAIRRTRGTHVVLEGGLVRHAVLLTARSDGRVFFVLPWGGHTLLGTTDVDDPRDPEDVGPDAADIRYLLAEAGRAVRGVEGAVPVRAYAGVRPLALGRSATGDPSANPREHRILEEEGMMTVVGGKYTTHRALAAEVVDRLVAADGRRAPASATASSALGVDREGGVEALRPAHPARLDLPGGLTLTEAEVVYAVRFERAKTTADVLLRRSRLWLDGRALRRAADPASAWVARARGWDDARRRRDVESLTRALEAEARTIQEAVA